MLPEFLPLAPLIVVLRISHFASAKQKRRSEFASPEPKHWKRKCYAAPSPLAITLIYFTLRTVAYFRAPAPTPSRMDIPRIATEKEFLDDQHRSVAMWLR